MAGELLAADFELPPLEQLDCVVGAGEKRSDSDDDTQQALRWLVSQAERVIEAVTAYRQLVGEQCDYISALEQLKFADRLLDSLVGGDGSTSNSQLRALGGAAACRQLTIADVQRRLGVPRDQRFHSGGATVLNEPLGELAAELKYLLGLHYFGGLDVFHNPMRAWQLWSQAWKLSGRHYLQRSGRCYSHSGPVASAASYTILKTYYHAADLFPNLVWRSPGDWSIADSSSSSISSPSSSSSSSTSQLLDDSSSLDNSGSFSQQHPLFVSRLDSGRSRAEFSRGHPLPSVVELYETELVYARQMGILLEHYLDEVVHMLGGRHQWPLRATRYHSWEGRLQTSHFLPYREAVHHICRRSEAFTHRLRRYLAATAAGVELAVHGAELVELLRTELVEQHELGRVATEYCPLEQALAPFTDFPHVAKILRGLLLLPLVRAPRYELLVQACWRGCLDLAASAELTQALSPDFERLLAELRRANEQAYAQLGWIRCDFLLAKTPRLLELLPAESKNTVFAFLQPVVTTSTVAGRSGSQSLLLSRRALYALSGSHAELLWQIERPVPDLVVSVCPPATVRLLCHASSPASPHWSAQQFVFSSQLSSAQVANIAAQIAAALQS